MLLPKTSTTYYHAQLTLSEKDRAIKEFVVCLVLLNLIPRVFGQKRRVLFLVILGCWT